MALTSITKDFVVKAGALIEGTAFVTSSTGQTSTLQVNGGVAIAKNLVVGTTATFWGAQTNNSSLTVNGLTTLAGLNAQLTTATQLNITGISTFGGNTLFNGAVNTFSGALFVTGTNILTVGTGATTLGGTLGVTGVTTLNNSTTAGTAGGGTGALKVVGGTYVGDNLIVASVASSTATNTGNALYVAGGAYIEKQLTVQGTALFKDSVTFAGSATYVLSTNTFYTDNLIELHVPSAGVYGSWTVDDGKDIGLRFHYYGSGADKNAALVLANDTKYLEWYGTGAEDSTGTFSAGVYGTFKTGDIRLTGTTAATSTITGSFQVVGGAGVGGTVWAGALAASNLTTASGVVYSVGNKLQNAPVTWNDTLQQLDGKIGYSNTATNVAGGVSGSLPYQSGASTTQMLPIGTNGNILIVSGGNPAWSAPTGLTAGNATTASNIAGGLKDQIPYQSAAGQTVFNVGLTYNGTTFTATNAVISNTANSTGYNNGTGALQVKGGAAINNDLWVGGDINLQGSLFLKGVGLDQITGSTGTFDYVILEGTGTSLSVFDGVTIGGSLAVTGYTRMSLLTATIFTATSANIIGNETVGGTLAVTGYSTLGLLRATDTTVTNLTVTGNESVTGTLGVTGYTTLTLLRATDTTVTNVTASGNISVGGAFTATGYSTLGLLTATITTVTQLTVIGNETVGGNLTVTGYSTLGMLTATVFTATSANIIGNETVGGTLAVTGYSTLGMVRATDTTVTNLTVTGNESVTGTLTVTGYSTVGLLTATIFTATSANIIGNETVGGTLGVTGKTTLNDVVVNTTITATNLVVTTSASLPGNIILSSLTVTNLTVTNNETIGNNLQVTGIFTASGTSNHIGIATFSNATDSNATNNGAVVVTGGVGIAKNLTVGTAVTVGTVSTQTVVTALYSNNTLLSSYTSGFIVSNSLINLDTFSASAYRTAKYVVQIVDGTKVHVEELLLTHDGTNVYLTEYGIVTSQGELGTFDAVLATGTVTLNFTANYTPTSMTVKISRQTITL